MLTQFLSISIKISSLVFLNIPVFKDVINNSNTRESLLLLYFQLLYLIAHLGLVAKALVAHAPIIITDIKLHIRLRATLGMFIGSSPTAIGFLVDETHILLAQNITAVHYLRKQNISFI